MVSKSVLPLVAVLAVSCSDYGPNHDLIRVSGLRPNLVESGDTLQIVGSGFAEGSSARISFRGDVFRPGEAPKRDIEIVVRTKDTSKDAVTFAVNDELEQSFCGLGPDATHAAFRGTVTLAFAAGSDTLAPVTGTLRGVNLEIVPKSRSAQAARERQQLSHDALGFLGLELTDDGATDCCTVASAKGRAVLAGIKPGDRLIQFDGVPVRAPTDLVPAGRNKTASVWVRRADAAQPVLRNIDVQGFRWSIPSELATAFGALLLAVGFIFGLNSHARRLFGSLSAKITQAMLFRRRVASTRRARLGGIRSWLEDLPLPEFATLRIAQVFAVIVLGGLCAVLSLREELVSAELDLVLWWLVSTIAVSVATLTAGVVQREGILRSLVFATRALAHQAPLLVVIALAMAASHSPRIVEMVRIQGPWPSSWLFFHDPAFAVASALAMGALIPTVEWDTRAAQLRPDAISASSVSGVDGVTVLLTFLSARVHLWLQSVLLTILLFGGWAIPVAIGERHRALLVLPALVLLAKTWVVISCLSSARSIVRSLTHRHTTPWLLKVVFPLSLLCGLLSLLWTWGIRHWSLPWAGTSLRWVMLSAFVVLLSILVLRVQRRMRGGVRTSLENYWT